MVKEKLEQGAMNLEDNLQENSKEKTIYVESLQEESSKEEAAPKKGKLKKKNKHAKEPKALSIEENYYIDEDGDKISPPNREIFEEMTGISVDRNYIYDYKPENINEVKENNEIVEVKNEVVNQNSVYHPRKKSNNGDNVMDQSSSEIETRQGDIYSDDFEYTSRKQRKDVIGMYKFAKKSIKTKIILVSILTVLLFLVECIDIFVKTPIAFLSNPYVLTVTNFVIFLACVAICYEQLYHGAKSIFTKEYIPESVVSVSVLCAVIHSLLMLLFISFESNSNQYKLFNFPVALVLVCSLVYSYINVTREKYGFGVISSKDIKYYLDKPTKSDDFETESYSSSFEEYEFEISKIKKTAFVKNYFTNTNTPPKLSSYLSIYITCSLLISAVLAIISLFNNYGFFNAVSVWYTGVLFTLPVGILFSYSVPFLKGNKYLYEDETAIIGEKAINEFATTDSVFVNDTTAFPPYNVKLTHFQTFGNIKTETILFYAAKGFSVVGGPLADVFGCATKDAHQKESVAKFSCAGKDYFCVNIDGGTVIFADRDGMESRGIDVGPKSENEASSSVLYMACNSTLCAKFFLTYKFDSEFIEIVTNLNKSKVGVGIRTFDPNINQQLIDDLTKGIKINLKVIRTVSEDSIPVITAESEAKIVSRSHSKYLLKAVPVCKKISKIRKVTRVLKVIASLAGATAVGLSLFGMFSFVNSIVIAGYQIAIIMIMFFITSIIMPTSK